MLQHCYNNVINNEKYRETWKQYPTAGCIINIEIHSPLRGEPPVTVQMAVIDFSGADSDLEDERGIGTQRNNRKIYYTQLPVID